MQVTYPDNEKELLTALREGNKQTFSYIYDQYNLRIYRKLLKMVRVELVAQELTQDLFIKVWEKRHQIDPEKSFRSYLYKIAENIVYDFYRKLARESLLQKEVQAISTELHSSIEENLILKETKEMLDQAVEQLPAQQKQVFTLCKFEGKSYEEVAEILGISVVTVNTHIVRATKNIKSFIFTYENATVIVLSLAIVDYF